MTGKRCAKCGGILPREAFSKRSSAKDGLASYCKRCQADYTKTWRGNNADVIKTKKALDYRANKDAYREKNRAYREANAEALAAAKRDWRLRNADRNRNYWRKYNAAHRSAIRDYRAKWREANPDTYAAVVRNDNNKRREAVKGGTSARELHVWLTEQDKVCFYCGAECSAEYHIDHFVPIARGGLHNLNNLKISCPTCNFKKSAKEPLDFMGLL